MDRTQAALTKDEKKNQKESADRTNKIRWRKSFEDAFFSRRSRRIEKQTNDERNSEEKMQKIRSSAANTVIRFIVTLALFLVWVP